MIVHDTEDGEVLYEVEYENRRDGSGRQLGPKPPALAQKPYDLRQIDCDVEPRLSIPRRTVKAFARVVGRIVRPKIRVHDDECDVSNNPITGP